MGKEALEPCMALDPGISVATSLPFVPHSHTRTWYSGWNRSSWSWSGRAMCSSSATRLSCDASWPTSWIRVQVTFGSGAGWRHRTPGSCGPLHPGPLGQAWLEASAVPGKGLNVNSGEGLVWRYLCSSKKGMRWHSVSPLPSF